MLPHCNSANLSWRGGRGGASGACARQCWMDPLIAQVNERKDTCATTPRLPPGPDTCPSIHCLMQKDGTLRSFTNLCRNSENPLFMMRNKITHFLERKLIMCTRKLCTSNFEIETLLKQLIPIIYRPICDYFERVYITHSMFLKNYSKPRSKFTFH